MMCVRCCPSEGGLLTLLDAQSILLIGVSLPPNLSLLADPASDVREPNEVALGSIPSSVNLPLSSFEKSLSMDEGAFSAPTSP